MLFAGEFEENKVEMKKKKKNLRDLLSKLLLFDYPWNIWEKEKLNY